MNDFTEWTIDRWLDALADRKPTPGGGAVAACAGALASALGRMVSAYSVGPKTSESTRAQFDRLSDQLRVMDHLLRALMSRDAEAYVAMTEASRAAKDDPSTQPAYQEAVLAAVAISMEVAAVAAGALSALDAAKEGVSRYMVSDLGVAAVMACAAADAAGYLVRVNLADIDDDAIRSRLADDVRTVARRCAAHRSSIESFVSAQLERNG